MKINKFMEVLKIKLFSYNQRTLKKSKQKEKLKILHEKIQIKTQNYQNIFSEVYKFAPNFMKLCREVRNDVFFVF